MVMKFEDFLSKNSGERCRLSFRFVHFPKKKFERIPTEIQDQKKKES